jgi:prolyl-tRNA editing enzyme YbaK/EbsC (Cys-tRNA(Pro) deacylase)
VLLAFVDRSFIRPSCVRTQCMFPGAGTRERKGRLIAVSPATQRLIDFAVGCGVVLDMRDFPEGTKTAADAAAAIGCDVAAIVKSLVFTMDGSVLVALLPGDLRLDHERLSAVAGGGKVDRATLDTVRVATGFVAGGTPPFGHETPLPVFADRALRRNDPVWAAGGTPSTVFAISLDDLDRLARPTWADIAEISLPA